MVRKPFLRSRGSENTIFYELFMIFYRCFMIYQNFACFCLVGSAYKRIGKRVMKPAQRAPMSTKLCMRLDMIQIQSVSHTKPHET